MSTYLVAFVVSNFIRIKKYSPKYNIEIQVAARPDAIKNGEGEYALEETARLIDYFIDYFNVSYSLNHSSRILFLINLIIKLFQFHVFIVQIAIPDFESGAMENFGLITYREIALLYNNKTDTSINKKYITLVISHELAHQWFGNLVTLSWWNDLWYAFIGLLSNIFELWITNSNFRLNEGFASWFEYLGINMSHPEWHCVINFYLLK